MVQSAEFILSTVFGLYPAKGYSIVQLHSSIEAQNTEYNIHQMLIPLSIIVKLKYSVLHAIICVSI